MANISFYGSHNAALCVEDKGEILVVMEIERFNAYKNSGLAQFKVPVNPFDTMKNAMAFIKRRYGIEVFDTCFSMNVDSIWGDEKIFFDRYIPARRYDYSALHHESHVAGAFYQSDHQRALAFSFDGGGNDGFFNVYSCERKSGVSLLNRIDMDYGFPYMVFGQYLNDIKFEPSLSDGNLIYPGKIMGLVSYGKVRQEWLEDFKSFYNAKPDGLTFQSHIAALGEKIGVEFNQFNRLEGEVAYDIAATSQRAFEECFLDIAKPYFEQYPDHPVIVAGGCGLNILLNTRLREEFGRDVFVGPSPNDCGLATGMMLNYIKPQRAKIMTYKGLPIMDEDALTTYFHRPHMTLEMDKLVDIIRAGKIVGVLREGSETGPRALGNRSIICDPAYPMMKDILNQKVKHREWYRPFAPMVRAEDVSKYFHFEGESPYMSFAPKVREEWRYELSSITHVDGTARVQTVTQAQNPFMYDLLTRMDAEGGAGVLLNTSFNVDGQPILTSIKDAFHVFGHSQMDMLLVNDILFTKHG
jgi:carbamoyltransferase